MLSTVIVIDDSETDRFIAERVLKKNGVAARVIPFSNGHQALEFLDDPDRFRDEAGPLPPPVLILLDIAMPRVNGFAFLDAFQERVDRGIFSSDWAAVAMLTSSSNAEDKSRALQFNKVIDYVVKPLDADAALRIAKKHLSQ